MAPPSHDLGASQLQAARSQLLPTAQDFVPRSRHSLQEVDIAQLPQSVTQHEFRPSELLRSTGVQQPMPSPRQIFGNAPTILPRVHSQADWSRTRLELNSICPKLMQGPYTVEDFDRDMRGVVCVRPAFTSPEDVQLDLVRHVPCFKHDWHSHWQWLALGGAWGKDKSQKIAPRLPGLLKRPFNVDVFRRWADALPCTCDIWYAELGPLIAANVLNHWPAVHRVSQSVDEMTALITSLPIDPAKDFRRTFAADPMALEFGGIAMSWFDSLEATPRYNAAPSTTLSADRQLLLKQDIAEAYHMWIYRRLFEFEALRWIHFNRQCTCNQWFQLWRKLVWMNSEDHNSNRAFRIPLPTSFQELQMFEREQDMTKQRRIDALRHNQEVQDARKEARRQEGWNDDDTTAFRGHVFPLAIPDSPRMLRHIVDAPSPAPSSHQRGRSSASWSASNSHESRVQQPGLTVQERHQMLMESALSHASAVRGGAVFGRKTIWHPDVDSSGEFPFDFTPGDRLGATFAPTLQQYFIEGDQRVSTNWGFFRRVLPIVLDVNFVHPDEPRMLPQLEFDRIGLHLLSNVDEIATQSNIKTGDRNHEIDDNESLLLGSLMAALDDPDQIERDDGGAADREAESRWQHAASLCTRLTH